jgi:L-ascorbate metabolism protein UlaG (beta-lactamase superfamily)
MKIKWNGHSSFTITAADGMVIVTDPYESGSFGNGIMYDPVDDRADVALVSHEHADHNFTKSLQGKPVVLKKGGNAGGLKFAAVEVAHDEKGGAQRGKNVMFAFTVDGIRVAHLGDLGHLLTEDQLEALGQVDLLLAPVGGLFTVDPPTAAKLVDQIKPRVVIPMHYKTPKCGFPLASVDDFAKLLIRVKKTGQTEIEINSKDLPASGPEAWIMEYAR